MIKLIINLFVFFIISSCQVKDLEQLVQTTFNEESSIYEYKNDNKKNSKLESEFINYYLGEPYFIEGVEYIPQEDYVYNKIGLASFYGKEMHNVKTINNDLNKVTELLGRHKTLPLPSIVKIINLENGLFLILKINDRHQDNSSIIQVSRKSAQLLKFYKNKIAKVRIEILADPSKQMKIVTQSMNEPFFNDTMDSAPVIDVSITDMDDNNNDENYIVNIDQPIEIGFEQISNKDLFLKVSGFLSKDEAKNLVKEIKLSYNFNLIYDNGKYILLIGPLKNIDANNLVLSFISKGYKKTEFLLK